MKKLSGFLVAVMMFVMVATAMGRVENVNAFPESEIDYSQYEWYESSKAGTSIYFRLDVPYEEAKTLDVTGWKAGICPENNLTLAGAVVTVDVLPDYKWVNDEYQYGVVSFSYTLKQDIPEGDYVYAFFDKDGKLVEAPYLGGGTHVNKVLVSSSCWVMNNDGYAYAYVYSENPVVNASTYPTLYAADQTTPVTTFADYTVGKSRYGETVHYYKLKITDAAAIDLAGANRTCTYYSMGTPTLATGNDGGVGLLRSTANGIDWTYVMDLNAYAQEYPDVFKVEDPFNAPSPSTGTVTPVAPPTEQPVVLPNGESAVMVTTKGDPNVYVIGDPEVVPAGTTFSSEPVTSGASYDASASAVSKYVGAGLEIAVFEMNLTAANGAQITQLGDYINVTLPIPAHITLDPGKTLVVYRVENGRLVRCDTAVDGGFLTFATNHFSTYVIVEQDASAGPALIKGSANSPKTMDASMLPVMMGAVAIMGAAVVATKKKNEI